MTENTTPVKKIKNKGPIRFEAIIPVAIIMTITLVYFSYYFDRHLKLGIEYIGTQANGAEVNVASVRTSFLKGSFNLDGLEVTDKEMPKRNILFIENVHFKYLWDALLRLKFVVEDASINNIQIYKPRKYPGKVLPPQPATPSKMEAIQKEIIGQVKNKYSGNILGDLVSILDGGNPEEMLQQIREELKSEKRIKEMVSDIEGKKKIWDEKVKKLSDTSKIKEAEEQIQRITKNKNVLEQAKGVKELSETLKGIQKQYKEIKTSSQQLEGEIKAVASYPKEIQALVKDDIADLKNRFKIPHIDFKDLAMNLFLGEFAGHIAKARKYQALAEQYIPTKKEEEPVIPPKRADGKNYHFPVTTGYPLFWLKRAAISSSGTKDTYSGNIKGELTHVTNAPKQVGLPLKLLVAGDFPGLKIMGVRSEIVVDHTKEIGHQSIEAQIASFEMPEKMFVQNEKMAFGYKDASASTRFFAKLQDGEINATWNSAIRHPAFVVDTKSKLAKEMLTNILAEVKEITINGTVSGPFKSLNFALNSNLGDALGDGLKKEIGAKVAQAQEKVQKIIDDKIKAPQEKLMSQLGGNGDILSNLKNIDELYKKNEERIKQEIEKLKKGTENKAKDDLKEKGKKFLKGLKF